MEKFEALWAYQEEDMKADAIAAAIRRSPTRQKLEKARDFILDRQKQYKQIEEDVAAMVDRKDIIAQAIARSRDQLQVGLSQLLLGTFIAGFELFGNFNFLFRGQKRHLADFLEIHANRVVNTDAFRNGQINRRFAFNAGGFGGLVGSLLFGQGDLTIRGVVHDGDTVGFQGLQHVLELIGVQIHAGNLVHNLFISNCPLGFTVFIQLVEAILL